ncbi:hypothetical protein E2C01_035277 [Portunus trituberculatus]|uniref:Uncharacterized protein n=1 Tax=Portunus trituberculatus TaxID=210409 RepID=A0A5B7F819_PORTR|nr:hypothetical protein [Portunus trituberculatus]
MEEALKQRPRPSTPSSALPPLQYSASRKQKVPSTCAVSHGRVPKQKTRAERRHHSLFLSLSPAIVDLGLCTFNSLTWHCLSQGLTRFHDSSDSATAATRDQSLPSCCCCFSSSSTYY